MRAPLILLFALTTTTFGGEKAQFWSTWEPRPALRDFWRPVQESWWDPDRGIGHGASRRLAKRCEDFARTHAPEAMVPELIADLRASGTEVIEVVYEYIMVQWPQKRVLRLLERMRHSSDPAIRQLAEEIQEDLLEWHKRV